MIETPQIVQTPARNAAVIHLTIPRDQIKHVMGPAMGEVMATVQAQGLRPAGPMFSHHFRMSPDRFDFEVGVPVEGTVKAAGRVKPGSLPALQVLRTTYVGPYEGLGDGWGEFMRWIAERGHKIAADFWESYVSGPESSPDPSQWRTELNRPLA